MWAVRLVAVWYVALGASWAGFGLFAWEEAFDQIPDPNHWVLYVAYVLLAAFLAVCGVTAVGLWRLRPWGRVLGLVASGLLVFTGWFTVPSAIALAILLYKPGKAAFEPADGR